MNPKELIEKWIELFNEGNPEKKKQNLSHRHHKSSSSEYTCRRENCD